MCHDVADKYLSKEGEGLLEVGINVKIQLPQIVLPLSYTVARLTIPLLGKSAARSGPGHREGAVPAQRIMSVG